MPAARELASGHDHHIAQSYLALHRNRKLRHAIEVRHERFVNPPFIHLMRRYHAAPVVSDSTEHWPYIEDVTADFVCLRLHGTENKYASAAYSDPALQRWARRIACWAQGGLPDDAMLPVSDSTHHAPPRILLF